MPVKNELENMYPSLGKRFIKCADLQDLMFESMGKFSPRQIAAMARKVLDEDAKDEVYLYAVLHLWSDVEEKRIMADPVLREKRKQERQEKAKETEENIRKEVTEWDRKLVMRISNMDGKTVRNLHAIPVRYFVKVADDQLVSDVISHDELMALVLKYC